MTTLINLKHQLLALHAYRRAYNNMTEKVIAISNIPQDLKLELLEAIKANKEVDELEEYYINETDTEYKNLPF